MTADGLTSSFAMTDGERLVWAASYAAYVAQGNRPEVAARAATLAVLGLRLITTADVAGAAGSLKVAEETCQAVADITGRSLPPGPEAG